MLFRSATLLMFTLEYLLVAWLVVSGAFSWLLLTVLGALPWYRYAWMAYTQPRPSAPPPEYPPNIWPLWYSAFAFQHTRRFGGLFLVGLALDVAARKFGLV